MVNPADDRGLWNVRCLDSAGIRQSSVRFVSISNANCIGVSRNLDDKVNKLLDVLKCQHGFISVQMLLIALVVVLVVTSVIMGTAFAAKKNANATYMWFGEAMEFGAQASNMDGNLDNVVTNTPIAKQFFIQGFSDITKTTFTGSGFSPNAGSPYPSSIVLNDFRPIVPGDRLPNGAVANQFGYLAEIVVPVLATEVPFIGQQTLDVPMRYFAVVKSQQIY